MDRKKLNHKYFSNVVVNKFSKNILSITHDPNARDSIIDREPMKIKNSGNLVDAIMNQAKRAKSKTKPKGKTKEKLGEESLEDYFARKDGEKKGKKKASTTTSAFAKMLYSLGLVILLVLAVAWLFKKFSNGSKIATKSKMVEILSREYIGAKSYVAVAKVLDRYLLLGITNENISTLAELDSIPEELLEETKPKSQKFALPKMKKSNKKRKVKKQKEPATGIFKKVLGDVAGKVVNVKDIDNLQEVNGEEDTVSFDSMQRIGEETLKRRAMGVEKKGDIDQADEFARNFAQMIKEKVKDLPEI
jgi:flagellar biosynthetic protein FliO